MIGCSDPYRYMALPPKHGAISYHATWRYILSSFEMRAGNLRPEIGPRSTSPTPGIFFFFFFALVTGPKRSLSLDLGDTRIFEPQIRACLGTTAHFYNVVVLTPDIRCKRHDSDLSQIDPHRPTLKS